VNSDGLMCELLKFQYSRCDHIEQTQEVLPSAIGRRLTKRGAHAICRFNRNMPTYTFAVQISCTRGLRQRFSIRKNRVGTCAPAISTTTIEH
jgi:hypothetical protein